VGQDYSWLGSIVYIAQLVAQPVIAYFLVKLPTGKFAASMVLCWGIVLSCMSVAKNFKGLLATRFFLGCFEASVGKWPHPRIFFADARSSDLCGHHADVVEKK
jgi:MFS family permease